MCSGKDRQKLTGWFRGFPVRPIHKMLKLVLLAGNRRKSRKSRKTLYSCIFEAVLFDGMSLIVILNFAEYT